MLVISTLGLAISCCHLGLVVLTVSSFTGNYISREIKYNFFFPDACLFMA